MSLCTSERAKKEDQEGFVITGSPSFLESVRNSFSYSLTAATKQNDMVLSEMRSPEQSQSREVQGLLVPLERGMGALQTQSTKPQQIEEGSTGATQQRKCGGKLAGFPAKVPWITSTPGRMVSTKTEVAGDAMRGNHRYHLNRFCLHLQRSPSDMEESLSSEEIKILEHLRGLQSMGMELSESMEQQLQLLATKENKMNSTKVLSHGHLNKYKKLKGQVATSAKRIKELDTEWNAFVSRTMAKIKEHGLMYQRCRSDMLEQYNQKLAELHSIKEEVSVASRSLIGQPDMEEGLEDAPDLEGV